MLRAAAPVAASLNREHRATARRKEQGPDRGLVFPLLSAVCCMLYGVWRRRGEAALPRPETVADIADGFDEGVAARLYLGTETPDMDVDGAGASVEVVAPHLLEQCLSRKYPLAVCGQKAQQ